MANRLLRTLHGGMLMDDHTRRRITDDSIDSHARDSVVTTEIPLPRLIKAEVNLLRLPLFALHTKGLRTLDGIECHGTVTRNGQTHKFLLRATRNTDTLYPGPLARAAHQAFLSIATDEIQQRGHVENPIGWRWRDLFRRMQAPASGRAIIRTKAAIESTRGLLIRSNYAIYSKAQGELINHRQDDLSLYDRITFAGSRLSDGTVADANYLWFSSWYLENLNALYTAPLDYDLWLYLNKRMPIASRLYEFLLVNFYSGAPMLRINYPNLAQFLPVTPKQYLSEAQRQLNPAFHLLKSTKIISSVPWTMSKYGVPQVNIHRGQRLTATYDRGQITFPFMEEEFPKDIEVKELRNLRPPEWQLVADFYRLWSDDTNPRPTNKELQQARGYIEQYGTRKAKALIPLVTKRLRLKFPDAKTFGATRRYIPDSANYYDKEQKGRERIRQEELQRKKEAEEQDRKLEQERETLDEWTPKWDQAPQHDKGAIRDEFLAKNPYLKRSPKMLERFCVLKYAEQHATAKVE